jgi:hypothetical protein
MPESSRRRQLREDGIYGCLRPSEGRAGTPTFKTISSADRVGRQLRLAPGGLVRMLGATIAAA